jgi:hypothetical protein
MTSKIKVDNIADQDDNNIINESGDVITVGAAGDTVAVAGNIVKSNALQASDGGNIVNQSGTTITLGASGDTITLASGASQTGFGRTGTVDWQTSIKTSNFDAVSGQGFFVNSGSGAITVTLPASPSAGDIVSISDYGLNAATNNITIGRNSQPISGVATNGKIDTNGGAVTLVYADSTKGWIPVNDTTAALIDPAFVAATGGTVTTVCTNFKVHTFTGPGTFCVSNAGNALGSNSVDYLVLAGGGGGGGGGPGASTGAGGGGAGGFRESPGTSSGSYSVSPLAGGSALSVPATAYPIVVGGGGSGAPGGAKGSNGSNSSFSSITSTGGGAGGGHSPQCGSNGGSGGAGSPVGSGNTPPVSPAQGQPGSSAGPRNLSGGGGATQAGQDNPGNSGGGEASGGSGATTSISSSPTVYAGGGGGGGARLTGYFGIGGSSIGGNGGADGGSNPGVAASPANRGSGGGGGADSGPTTGGAGSSGVVIIRYKFQ